MPDESSAPSPYHRSRDGHVIHRASCTRKGNAAPWAYARRMTAPEVEREINLHPWLRECQHCKPTEADHG